MFLCTNGLGILLIKVHRCAINMPTRFVSVSIHLNDRHSRPRPTLLGEEVLAITEGQQSVENKN